MADPNTTIDYTSDRAQRRLKRRERIGNIFAGVLLVCTISGLLMLTALLIDVALEGIPWLSPRVACAINEEASLLCDPALRSGENTDHAADTAAHFDGIAASQFSLGFMAYDDYQRSFSRVKPIAIQNDAGTCVLPTPEAPPGGEYPLPADLVVVVNRQNDWLECLTPTQLASLLHADGSIVTWADLYSAFPAEPIAFSFPGEETSTYETMRVVIEDYGTPPLINSSLFTNYHSRHPREAGMKSAIIGSLIIIGLTGLFSFPLGVGAAIYMEEYAPRNRLTNFINVNINNLAGVPSIVYGMLGLAVFGRMFGVLRPEGPFARWMASNVGGELTRYGIELRILGIDWLTIQLPFQRSMLAGALTMTLLILPIVIIASREAIRAVPRSIREAAYGLGATRWQVVYHQVLPASLPGIMTGVILALSRAVGETAPLIIMGAFVYVPFLPESIWDQFTAMPIQIYNWITLPQHEYRFGLAGAGIIVLVSILLAMNGLAVFLRNRFEIEW